MSIEKGKPCDWVDTTGSLGRCCIGRCGGWFWQTRLGKLGPWTPDRHSASITKWWAASYPSLRLLAMSRLLGS